MPWKTETLLSIISVVIAFGGFLLTYFGYILKLQNLISEQKTELFAKLSNFENQMIGRLVALETKTSLFWKVVEDGVIDMIKQPVHLEKDGLLDNFQTLDGEGLQKLKFMLQDELLGLRKNKDPKIVAYVLMLARIDQILFEKNCGCEDKGV